MSRGKVGGKQCKDNRSTTAIRWWLLRDKNDAVVAREDLLSKPIWRQPPQGYLEASSHEFTNYVIAYDALASWKGLSKEDQEHQGKNCRRSKILLQRVARRSHRRGKFREAENPCSLLSWNSSTYLM